MQLDQSQIETLYGIFTPRALSRQKMMSNNSNLLVHYTTAENGLKILKSGEIWLRNARAMQDFSEVEYGYQHLFRYFSDVNNKKSFFDSLGFIDKNLGENAFKLFDNWWGGIQSSSYIACFSEHSIKESEHGRLSMWRGFTQGINGVALVFKYPKSNSALPLNIFLTPVEYRSLDDFIDEINEILKNIDTNKKFLESIDKQIIINAIYIMLMTMVVTSKHPGFHEEQEWRMIHAPLQNPSIYVPRDIEAILG